LPVTFFPSHSSAWSSSGHHQLADLRYCGEVNNAGGGNFETFGKKVEDIAVSDLDKMMEINVKPVLRLSQLAVPHLEKTKGA
ncbi:hypothetical protein PENTCL1PPCAC_16131, partial [Pristionchus entomophagus]